MEQPTTISIIPIKDSYAHHQLIAGSTLSKPKTVQSHPITSYKNSDESDEVTSPTKKKTTKKMSTTLRPIHVSLTPSTIKSLRSTTTKQSNLPRPTVIARFTTIVPAKVIPVHQLVKPNTVLYSTTSHPIKHTSTTSAAFPKPTLTNLTSQVTTEQTSTAAPVLQSPTTEQHTNV